jgi:PAS domain S-box-containing protein
MAGRRRIMLVEDSPTQAQRLRTLLQTGEMDVIHAASAEAALDLLESFRPEAIVLDYNLPGMNGAELCRDMRLNINTRAVPILMLTVEQCDSAQMRGLESGADDYLAKSADPDILLARLRNLLRKSAGSDAIVDIADRFGRARLLAIDDSPTYLHFIARELRAEHYLVETASNGAAGLELLRQKSFDGVLVNFAMPEMDGAEICWSIARLRREHGASLVVILLTAHEDKQHMIAGLEAGADDYVVKSADMTVIKTRVRALLRRKFLTEENRRIVDELREKELRAKRARAEMEAAEVRAPLADELAEANRKLESANRKLEEALNVTQAITGHAAEALLMVDSQGLVSFVNPAAERMFGFAADELLGRPLDGGLKHTAPDGTPLAGADYPLTRCLAAATTITAVEGVFNARGGATVDVVCSFAPVVQNGNVTAAVLVLHDISERKRAETRLRQAQKLESIALLAGGIAHDFNNLLTGILGNASLAEELLPKGSPVRPMLNEVIAGSERAADLTRQMLAYSGKGRFLLEPVEVSQLVRLTVRLMPAPARRNVTLQLELAEDLPPVEADPDQLEQVINHLIVNAVESIGERKGCVTVRTRLQSVTAQYLEQELERSDMATGDYVCLEVEDTGCGIDEATKSRIFDPFFSTKFVGRGLGLAAVSGIVRGHNGAIKVTTAPRRGSKFLILLPVAKAREDVQARQQ